jgi:hypothetical protein
VVKNVSQFVDRVRAESVSNLRPVKSDAGDSVVC